MRIALGSDERTGLTDALVEDLRARGHEVVLVGPPGGDDLGWADVGRRVGELVAGGETGTAVLCCWTGTGASIAANKVAGVRAALCTDANVLVLSLRLVSPAVATEMLDAWFSTGADPSEAEAIASLEGPR